MVGVTTDGATVMFGIKAGAVSLPCDKVANNGSENLIKYHSIIQEFQAAHKLEMKHVMDNSKGLNHHQFKTFGDVTSFLH